MCLELVECVFSYPESLETFCQPVEAIRRKRESLIQAPETPSAFHPHAQRNAFRRRDTRQQSRSFARWKQSLRRSPNSNRPLGIVDHLRRRFARFKSATERTRCGELCAHLLDLGGLLFELRGHGFHAFPLLDDR